MQTSNWRERICEVFGTEDCVILPPVNIAVVEDLLYNVQKETIEWAIEVLPKPIEPVSSEGVDGYNEAIARSVEALKTLLH